MATQGPPARRTKPDGQARDGMNRFYDDIAADYDRLWGDQEYAADELAFLRDLAGSGPALEVGVGTGRVAIPLSGTGLRVVGVDPSPGMLEVLGAKADNVERADVEVLVNDLRLTGIRGTYTLIYCVFHTFFYADSRADQQRFLERARDLLAPGGRVVVEAYHAGASRLARWADGIRLTEVSPEGCEYEIYRHDGEAQTVHVTWVRCDRERLRCSSWTERYVTPGQLDDLATRAGLVSDQRWSTFGRAPFDVNARRFVAVYRLPSAGRAQAGG
ncbi:class I SAM-dependent DNA methyltransferase [Micromonospora sp. NPDC051227]|uniref:class I SAM-dependent DNA methyltransferase n=1 Tax=Micromonospora sp. NPDC051227 TaxID=3364285 RepID=UPI00193371E5|nr:class I SAM-dependent methyltransferase [Micromonospora sp. STR1s_5]